MLLRTPVQQRLRNISSRLWELCNRAAGIRVAPVFMEEITQREKV